MAAYAYSAINADGFELFGEVHAPSPQAAREQLRARGLLAESLDELPASGEQSVRTAFKKVKPKTLQVFSRQFATMIAAGLNVVSALVILEEQTDDPYFADVLAEVRADVEGGLLLSQALARHPKIFTRLYTSMVEAGEAAGILDHVLDRVALQIEKETGIKRRVKGALIYPTLVLAFASLIITAMLMFVIPVFQKMFTQLHGKLPLMTRVVVGASDLMRHQWYIVFPAIFLSIFLFRRWKRSERGRQGWDRFKLRIPMKIGDVVLKVTMARFSRTLSSLVAAGVDIVKALEITSQTAGNWVVERALAHVGERVQQGVGIAQPIAENAVFPPMIGHMVRVGEETGELDGMLGKIADFYEEEVDNSIKNLTSIIEPIMMIGVGALVGMVILAMYLPMFKLLTLVK